MFPSININTITRIPVAHNFWLSTTTYHLGVKGHILGVFRDLRHSGFINYVLTPHSGWTWSGVLRPLLIKHKIKYYYCLDFSLDLYLKLFLYINFVWLFLMKAYFAAEASFWLVSALISRRGLTCLSDTASCISCLSTWGLEWCVMGRFWRYGGRSMPRSLREAWPASAMSSFPVSRLALTSRLDVHTSLSHWGLMCTLRRHFADDPGNVCQIKHCVRQRGYLF